MREEIARLVYPFTRRGLQLKERLERGEALAFDTEQAALKALLLTDFEARRWTDFGGDDAGDSSATAAQPSIATPGRFLGVRYALVCWIDELFTLDSPWESQWNERKFEAALYGTNDRAWKFWEQARVAEGRATTDALEAFYLCVMLGFRGASRGKAAKLKEWISATQGRIAHSPNRDWADPPDIDPPLYLPPLLGKKKLRQIVLLGGGLLLLLVPIVTFVVVRQLG